MEKVVGSWKKTRQFIMKIPLTLFCLCQGAKAVIAESYERIHRSNLVGMGVIPLQFLPGQNPETLNLTGYELYDIHIPDNCVPQQNITVEVK